MSVIETKYSDFKERQSKRRLAFYFFIFFLIASVIITIYTFLEIRWFYYVWINIVVLGAVAGFLYVVTRSWFPEMVETAVFVNFYEAYNRIQACSTKDERTQLNLKMAYQKAKKATLILKKYAAKLTIESHSRLVKTEIAEPYQELAKNLETRILPRIIQRKNMPEIEGILCALAFSFSEVHKVIHANDIISRNKELKKYEPIKMEEPISKFRIILSKDSARIFFSFVFSFFGLIGILWVHSVWTNTNLIEAFKDSSYFLQFAIGVIAGGLGIYALIRQKT